MLSRQELTIDIFSSSKLRASQHHVLRAQAEGLGPLTAAAPAALGTDFEFADKAMEIGIGVFAFNHPPKTIEISG